MDALFPGQIKTNVSKEAGEWAIAAGSSTPRYSPSQHYNAILFRGCQTQRKAEKNGGKTLQSFFRFLRLSFSSAFLCGSPAPCCHNLYGNS